MNPPIGCGDCVGIAVKNTSTTLDSNRIGFLTFGLVQPYILEVLRKWKIDTWG